MLITLKKLTTSNQILNKYLNFKSFQKIKT